MSIAPQQQHKGAELPMARPTAKADPSPLMPARALPQRYDRFATHSLVQQLFYDSRESEESQVFFDALECDE